MGLAVRSSVVFRGKTALAAVLSALWAALAMTSTTGCTPAPVRAFEDFYAATVRKDGSTVRALLCGEARAAIADVDDATLLSTFSVQRVVRRAGLSHDAPAADGAVVVVVQDAVGGITHVTLRPDGAAPGGWCIAGVGAPSPATPPVAGMAP
jgi:hypothetical protein